MSVSVVFTDAKLFFRRRKTDNMTIGSGHQQTSFCGNHAVEYRWSLKLPARSNAPVFSGYHQ
jgi:hypothetical protein